MIVLSTVSYQIYVTVRIPCTLRSNLFYIKSIFFPNSSVSLVLLNCDSLDRKTKRLVDIQSIFHLSCKTRSKDTSSSTTSKLSKHRDGTQDVRVNLQRRTYIDRNIEEYRAYFEICVEDVRSRSMENRCLPQNATPHIKFQRFLTNAAVNLHIESNPILDHDVHIVSFICCPMKWKISRQCFDVRCLLEKRRSVRWQFRSLDQKLFESRITIWLMM